MENFNKDLYNYFRNCCKEPWKSTAENYPEFSKAGKRVLICYYNSITNEREISLGKYFYIEAPNKNNDYSFLAPSMGAMYDVSGVGDNIRDTFGTRYYSNNYFSNPFFKKTQEELDKILIKRNYNNNDYYLIWLIEHNGQLYYFNNSGSADSKYKDEDVEVSTKIIKDRMFEFIGSRNSLTPENMAPEFWAEIPEI